MELAGEEAEMDLLDFVALHEPPKKPTVSSLLVASIRPILPVIVPQPACASNDRKITLQFHCYLTAIESNSDTSSPPHIQPSTPLAVTGEGSPIIKRKKLPDWMILSPEQLQKVRKKRIRELNEKKEAFKSSACTQWGKEELQSSEEHILPPSAVGTEILTFAR